MKKNLIIIFVLISNLSFPQQMCDIISKLNFGTYFIIDDKYIVEDFKGDFEEIRYTGNTIFKYTKDKADFFLFLVNENDNYKLFFNGNFEYLKSSNFSVTNANKFILYDVVNNKTLLLKSGDIGLFSNKNGKIKISNSVNCLGRSIILLDNELNKISSITGVFERPCAPNYGFDDEDNQKPDFDKELIVHGDTILLKGFEKPLFKINISEIYDLLQN